MIIILIILWQNKKAHYSYEFYLWKKLLARVGGLLHVGRFKMQVGFITL